MDPRDKIQQILILFLAVLVVGTGGYLLMGWSPLDALYMTVITLATVGYGETNPLSPAGRVFTMFLILGGMGILLYSITELTSFLVEGEMTGLLRRRRMQKIVEKLSGHMIVCGCGRVGDQALHELQKTGREVVVIENDTTKVRELIDRGVVVVDGDASRDDVLKAAGIEQAAGLIAALSDDKENLFVTIAVRGLNPKIRIIAKVENVDSREKFYRSGVNGTVSPHFIGGLRMASELIRPATVSFLDMMLRDGATLRVEDLALEEKSKIVGQSIADCDCWEKSGVLLLSLKDGEQVRFNPSKETVLQSGQTLVVMGSVEQVTKVRELVNG